MLPVATRWIKAPRPAERVTGSPIPRKEGGERQIARCLMSKQRQLKWGQSNNPYSNPRGI